MHQVNTFLEWALSALDSLKLSESALHASATAIVATAVIFVSVAVYYIFSRVVAKVIHKAVTKTAITWDDILLNPRLIKVFSQLVLVIMLNSMLSDAFELYPSMQKWLNPILAILVVLMSTSFINQIILAAYNVICQETKLPAQSLKGIRQMLQLIIIIIAVIIVVSILIHKSPVIILSGLGASAAVLMLVFKDSILGLVAGVQLTANDMLKPGDWITAPKYGANGTVTDVTLTTVKVQNFDMTIVTIPPYSLVSEAFQNWRGMQLSGGRRICRSLNIDVNSVRFLTKEEGENFVAESWAADINPASGKAVNLSVFRRYLEHHICTLTECAPSMTAMVRELQPTPEGIPVEVYFFTKEKEWVPYEHIQADLIDHIVASMADFGLRIYQAPSGLDLRSLRSIALKA